MSHVRLVVLIAVFLIIILIFAVVYYLAALNAKSNVCVNTKEAYAELFRNTNVTNTDPFLLSVKQSFMPLPENVLTVGSAEQIETTNSPPGFKIKVEGDYHVLVTLSLSSPDTDSGLDLGVFTNDFIQANTLTSMSITHETNNATVSGILRCNEGDVVVLKLRSKDDGGCRILLSYLNMSIVKL